MTVSAFSCSSSLESQAGSRFRTAGSCSCCCHTNNAHNSMHHTHMAIHLRWNQPITTPAVATRMQPPQSCAIIAPHTLLLMWPRGPGMLPQPVDRPASPANDLASASRREGTSVPSVQLRQHLRLRVRHECERTTAQHAPHPALNTTLNMGRAGAHGTAATSTTAPCFAD